MSLLDSDWKPARRRRRGRRHPRAWQAGEEAEEVEAWDRSPSPRRGRWEGPAPGDWGPEELPAEPDAWGRASPSPPPVWDRAASRRAGGRPPSEDGGSLEEPRRQWEPPSSGGRWSSAEKAGGGRRGPPSPEAPSRQRRPDGEGRAWGNLWREGAQERSRSPERADWAPKPGKWASARRRREESRSPSREQRSLGSSVRDGRQESRGGSSGWNQPSREAAAGSSDGAGGKWGRTERRGREQRSPLRRQSGRGSPQREARQERLGSTRYHAGEQSQVNPDEAESRWREKSYRSYSRNQGNWESQWQNPNEEAKGQGGFLSYREVDDPENEERAEWNPHERRGEKTWTDAAGSGSPEASGLFTGSVADSSAVPKEWTPCESVVQWWSQCRMTLQKRTREYLMSTCPRPTLPDRSSETPKVNPHILSLLNNRQEKELKAATRLNFLVQEEVLDMLAPAMTIYEMAEEAMEKDEPIDPMELREWARRLLRFIGSINNRLIFQNRSQVLATINPRLRMVAPKMSGQSNDGMLFAEDKVKLLKEIFMRFPQLTEYRGDMTMKKLQTLARAAYYRQGQRRPFQRFYSKPVATGKKGTAVQPAEQSYSQQVSGQNPAEWH